MKFDIIDFIFYNNAIFFYFYFLLSLQNRFTVQCTVCSIYDILSIYVSLFC
jgi:hypothetical protein